MGTKKWSEVYPEPITPTKPEDTEELREMLRMALLVGWKLARGKIEPARNGMLEIERFYKLSYIEELVAKIAKGETK